MLNFIIRRLLGLIPTFLVITLVAFFVLTLMGDPFQQMKMNPTIPKGQIDRLKREWGFDQPWFIRYVKWLIAYLRGNWGYSLSQKMPVLDAVLERLPISLYLGIYNIVLTILIAIPLGIFTAIKQYTIWDNVVTFLVFLGYSMPSFFAAVLGLYYFAGVLKIFPNGGIGPDLFDPKDYSLFQVYLVRSYYLMLPVVIWGVIGAGGLLRYVRSAMLEVLNQDYIRTARAKGLPEDVVIRKHAFKNTLVVLVTILVLFIPGIIGGGIITEQIFSIRGIGKLMWDALNQQDISAVMGVLMIQTILTLFANLLADILYGVIDPRVRYS